MSIDDKPPAEMPQAEAVERVARAMFDADDHHPDLWDALNWEGPEDYRRRARAALATLGPRRNGLSVRQEEQVSAERKTVRVHWKTQDNRHWFCCGAGEQFVQAASKVVDADTLEALLPHVEVYARAQSAEQIREAADDSLADPFDRRALYEYADDLLDPCRCPYEHCGDCGCCVCDNCGESVTLCGGCIEDENES